MILEGIVTTINNEGRVNVAPMGPIVDESMKSLILRPFQTSRTFANLTQHGFGVFHVTDDVMLLAKSAIGQLADLPPLGDAQQVNGKIILSACRAYEFEVTELDDSNERTRIVARVVNMVRLRDFFGFNRAKHAVLEGAILATRVGILPDDQIRQAFAALQSPVQKTAGEHERTAFKLLEDYIHRQIGAA